ncbi:hypothetical protein [Gordoniibacillus kamchatkensis]|uniref:hypothetical protein n=1 Tax=Gordoniibacillus kamchatkensis TaxID=1590651 RepID=UPI0012E00E86|nr:hypothetical protein [Paenibacillus sp. VKM B-2647]
MSSGFSIDMASEQVEIRVDPRQTYSPATLVLRGKTFGLVLQARDEQLADIGDAINRHLKSIRYHEIPDHQSKLNHEYEPEAAHETET